MIFAPLLLLDSFGCYLLTDIKKLAFDFYLAAAPYCGSAESRPNSAEQLWCGMGIATFE